MCVCVLNCFIRATSEGEPNVYNKKRYDWEQCSTERGYNL